MSQPVIKKIEAINEKLLYFVMLIGPIMTLPQLYNVWFGSSEGVSIYTWITYLLTQVFWLIHAIKINDTINIISGVLWIFLNLMLVLGIIF